jgi:hypothetical protein
METFHHFIILSFVSLTHISFLNAINLMQSILKKVSPEDRRKLNLSCIPASIFNSTHLIWVSYLDPLSTCPYLGPCMSTVTSNLCHVLCLPFASCRHPLYMSKPPQIMLPHFILNWCQPHLLTNSFTHYPIFSSFTTHPSSATSSLH